MVRTAAALLAATLERCDAALDRIISFEELLNIKTTPSSVELLLCTNRILLGTVDVEDDEPASDTDFEGVGEHAPSVKHTTAIIAKDRFFGIRTMGNECMSKNTTLGSGRMQRTNVAKWLLILALVFVFAYFGIDKFMHPLLWIGWLPSWMDGLAGLPKESWLKLIGASEILFALMVLIPFRHIQRIGVMLIILHLLGILTQVGWNDVAVRDIGIMISGIALLALL
jgi:hypothetical protein